MADIANRQDDRVLYDGDAMVIEYNGANIGRYVHGDGEDDPLILYQGLDLANRRSLQADAQGSIVSIADSSGAALYIDSYDEYGIWAAGNSGLMIVDSGLCARNRCTENSWDIAAPTVN